MLEELRERGGRAKPAEIIDALTERFSIDQAQRDAKVHYLWEKTGTTHARNPWKQSLHWVRQDAATRGLIGRNERGIWTLTDKGEQSLVDCQPGMILIVYETPNGEVIWSDAITAAGAVKDDSLDLIYQSPPYPIATGRSYGTFTDSQLVELIMKCAPDWKRALKDSGSLVLNLKDCWLPASVTGGAPERSIYIDKLVCALVSEIGMRFSDRHFWRNPSCAPTSPFVTIQKVRAGCDVEHMLWFSKTRRPHADATQVMQPAKASTVATYLAKAKRGQKSVVCASGHSTVFEEQLEKAARGEEIKVLPRTIQEFANSAPQTKLNKMLKEAGLPAHPARMPLELAKWWVKFLTKPGGHVADFFGGHMTTGLACEELGRRWTCSERSLAYALGSALRFDNAKLNFEPPAIAA